MDQAGPPGESDQAGPLGGSVLCGADDGMLHAMLDEMPDVF